MPTKVILDVDTGTDDAVALMVAALSPEWEQQPLWETVPDQSVRRIRCGFLIISALIYRYLQA